MLTRGLATTPLSGLCPDHETLRLPCRLPNPGARQKIEQAPRGVGSGRLLGYNFAEYPGTEVDISSLDEAALAQLIVEREAER